MKQIAWRSDFRPTPRQLAELRRLYGEDVEVTFLGRVTNANDVIEDRRFSDDVVVVAPEAVLEHLTNAGLRPLYAEMAECEASHTECEVSASGKYFRFVRYRRLVKIGFNTQSLAPLAVKGQVATVLRITRHRASEAENEVLRVMYGDGVRIVTKDVDLRSGITAVTAAMTRVEADDLLLVGPLSLWDALCQQGIYPLRVTMDGNRFIDMKRVTAVVREFEEVL